MPSSSAIVFTFVNIDLNSLSLCRRHRGLASRWIAGECRPWLLTSDILLHSSQAAHSNTDGRETTNDCVLCVAFMTLLRSACINISTRQYSSRIAVSWSCVCGRLDLDRQSFTVKQASPSIPLFVEQRTWADKSTPEFRVGNTNANCPSQILTCFKISSTRLLALQCSKKLTNPPPVTLTVYWLLPKKYF